MRDVLSKLLRLKWSPRVRLRYGDQAKVLSAAAPRKKDRIPENSALEVLSQAIVLAFDDRDGTTPDDDP